MIVDLKKKELSSTGKWEIFQSVVQRQNPETIEWS